MEKARAEIEANVGQEVLLDEADSPKSVYLQKICSVHKVISSCSTSVSGFHVPRGTQLLVNAWCIHRDPDLWENPTKFMPERFESGKISGFEGYKMIPFGAGRRGCLGAPLGKKLTGMLLGALIQCFEWEKIDGKEIDMTEGLSQSLSKTERLKAPCKPRHDTRGILVTIG
ncbi:hypothetical protein ACLB2K_014871 [Fragaria x ananassa]